MANPIKWFSGALRAAERLPQNFGTSDQMAAMLQKYGAKQSELNYLKVPDFLKQFGGGRVSKSALHDYIDKNKVLPSEVVKKDRQNLNIQDDKTWNEFADWLGEDEGMNLPGAHAASANYRVQMVNRHPDQFDNFLRYKTEVSGTSPKYSDYASYPDSGYKETLLTLPQKHDKAALDKEAIDSYGTPWDQLPAHRQDAIINSTAKSKFGPLYQSSHWDEPNVLLHMRTSSPGHLDPSMAHYLPDEGGKEIPFLEELQSDWGQAGRKKGFKFKTPEQVAAERDEIFQRGVKLDPGPEQDQLLAQYNDLNMRQMEEARNGMNVAPLVTNTNDWASAGVRRFLAEAAQQDAPSVAWTTGAQQSARYSGHAPEGMAGFYDKMLPNIIQKYIKPYGGSVSLAPEFNMPLDSGTGAGFMLSGDRRRLADKSMPHTATVPEALRKKILEEGIPFFAKGGMIEKYATVI